MTGITPEALVLAFSALGAGLSIGIAAVGIGFGQGMCGMKGVEGVARQPEAKGDILQVMLVGQAVTETTGIFAFIISVVLLFANPFIKVLL
ncbi:MAG TPA: ATP synthase F0 subunit C [Clostridiales bacterium]|jgi:F-type H+-transporting ATPase subunit c|nr:ATP synthase F0 subunit C [Clostridiales bacterium]